MIYRLAMILAVIFMSLGAQKASAQSPVDLVALNAKFYVAEIGGQCNFGLEFQAQEEAVTFDLHIYRAGDVFPFRTVPVSMNSRDQAGDIYFVGFGLPCFSVRPFRYILDPDDQIAESNEENNEGIVDLMTSPNVPVEARPIIVNSVIDVQVAGLANVWVMSDAESVEDVLIVTADEIFSHDDGCGLVDGASIARVQNMPEAVDGNILRCTPGSHTLKVMLDGEEEFSRVSVALLYEDNMPSRQTAFDILDTGFCAEGEIHTDPSGLRFCKEGPQTQPPTDENVVPQPELQLELFVPFAVVSN